MYVIDIVYRDAPTEIFLADSDVVVFCKCDLPILIFFLKIKTIYKQKYSIFFLLQRIFFYIIIKVLNITIPPIWTNL